MNSKKNAEQFKRIQNEIMDIFFFGSILFSLFVLWLYLLIQWRALTPLIKTQPISFSFGDIVTNLKLAMQGFESGYLRTVLGYFYFAFIMVSFVFVGKYILSWIFSSNNQKKIPGITIMERFALYYMLGSLVYSLVWLGLGVLGIMNYPVSLSLIMIGIIGFVIELVRSRREESPFKTLKDIWSQRKIFSSFELFLTGLLFIVLLLWSTRAVNLQTYSDTLLTHIVLPNFYINQGKVITYPYHIHSYFPQNTEMLVMWGFLLNSEVASSLIIWGFLFSFVVLAWGFIKRYTDNFTGLLAVYLFISAPLFAWFSTTIKSDFSSGLFIFAHYLALIESFNKRSSDEVESNRWLLLGGILCGGAVGHKLIALPIVVMTSLFVLAYNLYFLKPSRKIYFHYFLGGLLIPVLPWFIRSFAATGNPIYPYLNVLFHVRAIKPWHQSVAQGNSISALGIGGLTKYLQLLLGIYHEGGIILPADWGPTILFGFLLFLCLRKKILMGFRYWLVIALLTWIAMIAYSLETRYHIGIIAFIVSIPFALVFHDVMKSKLAKFYKSVSVLLILLCFYHTVANTQIRQITKESFSLFLSGFSPGNFDYSNVDKGMSDLHWLTYIINTRSVKDDKFLYVGTNYAFGLKRKYLFSSDLDKQLLGEIAEQASDSLDLSNKLKNLGINNLIVESTIYNWDPINPTLKVNTDALLKIREMLAQQMIIRYATSDNRYFWFTFRDTNQEKQEIQLNEKDAKEFPFMFVETAKNFYQQKNIDKAQPMLEVAAKTPMISAHKSTALGLLGFIYLARGQRDKAEETILAGVNISPKRPEPYINLALLYLNLGQKEKGQESLQKAINLGGESIISQNPQLANFIKNKLGQ